MIETERFEKMGNYLKNLIEIEKFPDAKSKKILDIGSGDGFGLRVIKFLGGSGRGIEMDVKKLQKALAKGHSESEILFADASTIEEQFGPESMDIITIFLAPLYDGRFIDIIHQAARILRKEGTLLITTPTMMEANLLESTMKETNIEGTVEWHPEFPCDKYVYIGKRKRK